MQTDYGVLLHKLKGARDSALLTQADFSDDLKETVRLHHATWIVHPLNEVIALLEAAQAGVIKIHRRETYKSIQRMPNTEVTGAPRLTDE